jgi:hypothetical protein
MPFFPLILGAGSAHTLTAQSFYLVNPITQNRYFELVARPIGFPII